MKSDISKPRFYNMNTAVTFMVLVFESLGMKNIVFEEIDGAVIAYERS